MLLPPCEARGENKLILANTPVMCSHNTMQLREEGSIKSNGFHSGADLYWKDFLSDATVPVAELVQAPSDGTVPAPWRVGSLFFGASVFSLVLPGPVGELAACAALKKRYGIVFSRGLATAVHARLVGLASAALMAISVLPFVDVSSNLGEVLGVGAAMVCVAGLGVGLLTAKPSWMQWVSTTVERSPLSRFLGSAMILVRALSETGRAPLRTWLKVLAWSVVIQGVQLLTIAMVGMALGLVPALPGLLLAQGTGSLGILVGVILPGGLGTYEVAVISSFAGPGGLALASAGVLAVGIRIVHLLGLGSDGIMFAFWAKVLTAGEVMADVEKAQVER